MLRISYAVILYALCFVYYSYSECIEGEVWFKYCESCKCLNKTSICKPNKCMQQICLPGTTWFGDDYRCHCSKNYELVCVNLGFQPELNKKPCKDESYFYNTNTYCRCVNGYTKCSEIKGISETTTGYCEEGEMIIDNCYECTCTKTMFRICILNRTCLDSVASKPGRCVKIESFYSPMERFICIRIRKQECYSDYGCPEDYKCCLVTDCYYRCMEPNPKFDIFD